MKNEDLQALTNKINEKLGKENSAKISDDLGILIADTKSTNDELKQKDDLISKLKEEKENLLMTNSKLFQQVASGLDEKEIEKEKENSEDKKFSFKSCFDEKGNFI